VPAGIAKLAGRLTAEQASDRPAEANELLEALGVDAWDLDAGPPQGLAPRLIGRDAEMSSFKAALDALLEGRSSARSLVVVGLPGIGRTHLLREMKWVAQVRCDLVEGTPGGSITALLERALDDQLGPGLPSVLDGWRRLAGAARPSVLLVDDASSSARRIKSCSVRCFALSHLPTGPCSWWPP
jgi:hypothetical protein